MKTKLFLLPFLCIFAFQTLSAQKEIWGTVSNGGNYGHGYIFKTDSVGNNLQIVHHFDSINGKSPGALLAASNGKLYGITSAGGMNNQGLFSGGVFYEFDLTTSTFTSLQHFGPNNTQISGSFPAGDGVRSLTEVSPGIIYGQLRGAYLGGVIFSFNTTTNTISLALNLPTFQGGASNSTTGNRLEGNLFLAPDGYLYGTTHTNSQCPIPNPNFGSIVRINPANNNFSIQYLCPCTYVNGFQFESRFVTYNNKLYSVGKAGGSANNGVIYSFDPATNTYANLYNFQGGVGGTQPMPMVEGYNGKFYGIAYGGTPEQGFPNGAGILYEFDPSNNQFTKKLDFTYGNGSYMNVGPHPFSLINGHNSKLYAVNTNGIIEYDINTNQTSAKGRFLINMGWYPAATPSLTTVCRKPSHNLLHDSTASVCVGDSFTFNIHSSNSDQIVWKKNGVIIPSQTDTLLHFQYISAQDTGTWVAELTNECGTTIMPAVKLQIIEPINLQTQGNTLNVVNNTYSTYQWIDCSTNLAISNATTSSFTASFSGSYAVAVTAGSCEDTSSCVQVNVISVSEILPNNVIVFPNPANEKIYIQSNYNIESVKIYSISGQQLFERFFENEINVAHLSSGIYFCKILTENGINLLKFIKN